MRTTGLRSLTVACLIATMALAPSLATASAGSLYWKKVDFYVNEAGEGRKIDARLILDPQGAQLLVADEKVPERATFAQVPYDALTSITYSYSKHPRWKTGTALLLPLGVFAVPFFFMKGKKHWLAMTFEDVPNHPEGFLYLRLDKSNYLQIIAALEGQTGMRVERVEPD